MREIKFRAWDENMRDMLIVNRICFFDKVDRLGKGILDEHNDFHKFNEIKLMQFTGLKDKNGKEIYEGDLIKYKTYEDIETVGEVLFGNGSYGLKGEHLSMLDLATEQEVIGNIWENPELLKGGK